MKLGCHCVLFGAEIVERGAEILTELASYGSEGVEAGARFLSGEPAQSFMQNLTQSGMQLSGYHVLGFWGDLVDDYASVEKNLALACEFLADMPNKNIIFTGMHQKNPQDEQAQAEPRMSDAAFVKQAVAALDSLAVFCQKRGVQLHYHNHSWEFVDDALVYRTLISDAPNLYFAMDIGWAASSGWDVPKMLREQSARIRYLHLRDFEVAAVQSDNADFKARKSVYREIGEGDAFDWSTLLPQMAQTVGEEGWLVIEYETGEVNAQRYARAMEFLRALV